MKNLLHTLLLALSLLVVGPCAYAIIISGGLELTTTSSSGITVTLTNDISTDDPDIGSVGWRVWDTSTDAAGSDAKSGSNSVGSYTFLGGLEASDMGTSDAGSGAAAFDFAWVDGTPNGSDNLGDFNGILQTATAGGGLTDGQGLGIPVTLSGTEGQLSFYVGVRRTNAKAIVRDSDENVLYDSSVVSENLDASTVGSQVLSGAYVFDYSGGSIGEVVTLEWVNDGIDNNAQLQLGAVAERATVIPEPETAAIFLGASMVVLAMLSRGRRKLRNVASISD